MNRSRINRRRVASALAVMTGAVLTGCHHRETAGVDPGAGGSAMGQRQSLQQRAASQQALAAHPVPPPSKQ